MQVQVRILYAWAGRLGELLSAEGAWGSCSSQGCVSVPCGWVALKPSGVLVALRAELRLKKD